MEARYWCGEDSDRSGTAALPFLRHLAAAGTGSQRRSRFGEALGGRVVVRAHETCNSQSGSGAEGDLQRPNTLVNLIKARHGLHSSPVRGTFPSGRRADLNLSNGGVYSPPEVVKDSNGIPIRIEGTPPEVEKAYNQLRSRHPDFNLPEFNDLPPSSKAPVSYDNVNVDLVYDLKAAEAMAVKSALGACSLAYGSAFAASAYAAALRAAPTALVDPQRQPRPAALLGVLDAQIAASAAQACLYPAQISALPHLEPVTGAAVHDVILVPAGQRTLLYAHYLSEVIPPYGMWIDAPLPPLSPGLRVVAPILLRDGGARDQLEITDFTQVLMQPAFDNLQVDTVDGSSSSPS